MGIKKNHSKKRQREEDAFLFTAYLAQIKEATGHVGSFSQWHLLWQALCDWRVVVKRRSGWDKAGEMSAVR